VSESVNSDTRPRQAWAAVLIPALIQSYVGNILEPTVFGEALNVTALPDSTIREGPLCTRRSLTVLRWYSIGSAPSPMP
jgi:hypothetical protein